MDKPLVSVITITYNHEPWIAKTIEGVLMQKVDFPIEYIIAEDCSTDGTRVICERYAAIHHGLIKLLPSDVNHGPKENERRAMEAVRGKYIAFCEGDDYWTEPEKLQRQIDFLEAYPEYSVCFTRFTNYVDDSGSFETDTFADLFEDNSDMVDITMDMFFSRWCTQPLTMVYRADAIPLSLYDRYKYYRDQHQIYHLLKAGKGCILNFESGVRVKHQGGMASMINSREYCDLSLPMDRELWQLTKDIGPKIQYIGTLLAGIRVYAKDQPMKALWCAVVKFAIDKKIKSFIENLWFVIRS